jgi:hypothetical protein
MQWDIDATPDDLTIRAGLLSGDDDRERLAAARGCMFGLLFAAPFWVGVVAVAWRIATT